MRRWIWIVPFILKLVMNGLTFGIFGSVEYSKVLLRFRDSLVRFSAPWFYNINTTVGTVNVAVFYGSWCQGITHKYLCFKTKVETMWKFSFSKGQLISKWFFEVVTFLQKTNENNSHTCKNEFINSNFGGNRWPHKPFRNQVTFSSTFFLLKLTILTVCMDQFCRLTFLCEIWGQPNGMEKPSFYMHQFHFLQFCLGAIHKWLRGGRRGSPLKDDLESVRYRSIWFEAPTSLISCNFVLCIMP